MGARQESGRLGGLGAECPIILELGAKATAAQSQDRVGTLDGPEHSRALQSGADDGFAAGFYNSGTDK